MSLSRLERRAREIRSRAEIRRWEHRQRRHAKGTWFRLRRVLADARAAYAISEDEARRLLAEGHVPEPVGAELEPAKVIVFVSPERLWAIPDARPITVSLGAELLAARWIALIRFG